MKKYPSGWDYTVDKEYCDGCGEYAEFKTGYYDRYSPSVRCFSCGSTKAEGSEFTVVEIK
jgi:hypothetical protein